MSGQQSIYAVKPPRGTVVHLFAYDYNLSDARPRGVPRGSGLCNAGLWSTDYPTEQLNRRLVLLDEALGWKQSEFDPRPWWRWCRACVGHAVALRGMERDVLTTIAGGAA